MINAAFAITFLAYIVTGAIPALTAHFLLRVRFLGGAWGASLVGVIGAVIAGLADAILFTGVADLLVIAGAVDIGPPFLGAIAFTVLFGLVSSSNV
jgi:hypothetical protein